VRCSGRRSDPGGRGRHGHLSSSTRWTPSRWPGAIRRRPPAAEQRTRHPGMRGGEKAVDVRQRAPGGPVSAARRNGRAPLTSPRWSSSRPAACRPRAFRLGLRRPLGSSHSPQATSLCSSLLTNTDDMLSGPRVGVGEGASCPVCVVSAVSLVALTCRRCHLLFKRTCNTVCSQIHFLIKE